MVEENARIGVRMAARGTTPLARGAAARRDRGIEAIVMMRMVISESSFVGIMRRWAEWIGGKPT